MSAVFGRSLGTTAFMAFASPTERPHGAGTASRWFLLSWDSSVALPPAYLPRVHSQEPKLPSGRRCHTPARVPPSWFRTTSTVYSARKLRVCCTPQPVLGSPRFVLVGSLPRPKAMQFAGLLSPRRGSHPSKTSPRQQPYRITAAVAFLPLPSCPARVPTEAGVLADRRPPKRVTYIRGPYPRVAVLPCPEGRGGRWPCEMGDPASNAAGPPSLRRARETLPRWVAARGAPKNSVCVGPVRRSSRRSEECRLPCPVRRGTLPRGGVGGRSSEEVRFPVPVGWGAVGSEELAVPCPGGARRPRLRGAPFAWLRRGGARGAPKSAVCPAPEGRGTHPGWGGGPSAPKSWRFPVPVKRGVPGPGGTGRPGPPRRSGLPAPVGWGAVGSEELAVPCPGGVGGRRLRRAGGSLSRWVGGRGLRRASSSLPGEARRPALRRAPFAVPR
jgi:hypothetical protein